MITSYPCLSSNWTCGQFCTEANSCSQFMFGNNVFGGYCVVSCHLCPCSLPLVKWPKKYSRRYVQKIDYVVMWRLSCDCFYSFKTLLDCSRQRGKRCVICRVSNTTLPVMITSYPCLSSIEHADNSVLRLHMVVHLNCLSMPSRNFIW